VSPIHFKKSYAHWLGLLILVLDLQVIEPRALGAAELSTATVNELNKLLASGKLTEADAVVEHHLSLRSPSSETFLEVGRIYFEHDQWARAADLFRQSLELQNQNDVAHLLLGLSLAELKQAEESERELQTAVRQNPQSDINWYFAGWRLLMRGKYEASLPYFYKAVELNAKNQKALWALASALARTGSYGLAENYYNKAIELIEESQEPNPDPYLDLAYLLLLSNQKEPAARALECTRKAIAINPERTDAHYLCGKALVRLERYAEARIALVKACELNPKDPRPHFLLAQVYDRLGESGQAQNARQSFTRLSQKRADESRGMANDRP
jgi:tetratricopeptide (TPR) repeat protein